MIDNNVNAAVINVSDSKAHQGIVTTTTNIKDPVCRVFFDTDTPVVNLCSSKVSQQVSLPAKHISIHPVHLKKICQAGQPEKRQKHAAASKAFNRFGAAWPVYENKTLFVNIWKIDRFFVRRLWGKGVKRANKEKLKNRLENPARSRCGMSSGTGGM